MMKVFYGTDYRDVLVSSINNAQQSITLATMIMDASSHMIAVIEALHAALQRGIIVTLYIDVYNHIQFLENRHFLKGRQQFKKHLQVLEHNGATVIWLGKLGINPFKRRFHQKISIVDDKEVFFAGGINLTGDSFQFHDFMIRVANEDLATKLSKLLVEVAHKPFISDNSQSLDTAHTVLIDGGKPGVSIIYDTALKLTTNASQIIFVSQMAPSGKLARVLAQKPVTYYLNSPFSMSLISGISEFLTQARYNYSNRYIGKRYIHAKYMLFTMPQGKKIVLTGSHNFNERGVNYGTKEIALLAKDDALWEELFRYTEASLIRSAERDDS